MCVCVCALVCTCSCVSAAPHTFLDSHRRATMLSGRGCREADRQRKRVNLQVSCVFQLAAPLTPAAPVRSGSAVQTGWSLCSRWQSTPWGWTAPRQSLSHIWFLRRERREFWWSFSSEEEQTKLLSPLTCHVLVARAAQHGVHGMSHLVEEVLHHAGGQQGGGALGGRRQAEHQHHHRQLVLAALLAVAAAADGEVAVLLASDVHAGHTGFKLNWLQRSVLCCSRQPQIEQFVYLMRFFWTVEKVAVDVPQQSLGVMYHCLGKHTQNEFIVSTT